MASTFLKQAEQFFKRSPEAVTLMKEVCGLLCTEYTRSERNEETQKYFPTIKLIADTQMVITFDSEAKDFLDDWLAAGANVLPIDYITLEDLVMTQCFDFSKNEELRDRLKVSHIFFRFNSCDNSNTMYDFTCVKRRLDGEIRVNKPQRCVVIGREAMRSPYPSTPLTENLWALFGVALHNRIAQGVERVDRKENIGD